MKCHSAVEIFVEERKGNELVIANVGIISACLYTLDHRETHLYHVAMGYVSAVGLGLALALPDIKVISIEGDGSLLMELGVLCTIANKNPSNLLLLCMDNESYAAAGGCFPTATAGKANIHEICKGAGIDNCVQVRSEKGLRSALRKALKVNELSAIIAKLEPREVLKEPFPPLPMTQTENTYRFIRALVDQGLVQTWHEVYPYWDILP